MLLRETTVRAINAHLWAGVGACYVDLPDGRRIRVSRVRTRRGVIEGRVILGSARVWETIPPDAEVELTR